MDIQMLVGLQGVTATQIELAEDQIIVYVASPTSQACCPSCQQPSSRVHSYYTRSVADLAIGKRLLLLRFRVHRFRCSTPTCSKRTFTEQVPQLVEPRRRRTVRVVELLSHLAIAAGGEGGARLTVLLQMQASSATLRRCLRAVPLPAITTPKALGVDDFAWRKGQTYGTILIDLSTHRPIDLLPDRSADSFARWLQEHPDVEINSRDRAGTYADGASRGAPQAQQVADRFHLLQNIRETTERLLDREMKAIRAAEASASETVAASAVLVEEAQPTQISRVARESDDRSRRRQERFEQVKKLHEQGENIRQIVRALDVSRNTVRKYLRATQCPPSAARPRRPSLLDPFTGYLTNRWAEGCRNSAQLYCEIKAQGFAGSDSIVQEWAKPRRSPQTDAPAQPKRRPTSARSISWLLVRPETALSEEEQTQVAALKVHSDVIRSTYPLIQAFGLMVRERQADQLELWLCAAEQSGQADLKGFATGLRRDKQAVANALKLEWSNGPTEGAITRLKLLKRTGYGRASFETLRRRVLLAA